jgi:hypothetical protein
MPLSRLENFLKNAEGNILYVNPSDFDSTDSFENRGNSLTRPFRTIQRALVEVARFSYQTGKNNDKIDTTTILVYPGTHYIDNRPGFSITNQSGTAEFKQYINGSWQVTTSISEFTENSNFDIFDEDNDLYKFNSVTGGVILPRGASIVGLDLRKTKIRPLYVPDPLDDTVDPTAIFKVTGTCYFTSFTIFDADTKKSAYKNSIAGTTVAPTFSHHKLTCFEYADGVNNVILGSEKTDLTDLDMYYYKVSYAYGETSGRGIGDYPNTDDFEPSIDEFRIVGDLRADSIGITSIKAGNGVIPSTTLTIDTNTSHGLFKDTPVLISGITTNPESYDGSFLVSDVLSATQFQVVTTSAPSNPLPSSGEITNGQVIVESDSVSSASPYIFSCTMRSVYGMNGMWADGNKATGFKSMLTAQFTGISLQKDDNAFLIYDSDTGSYKDNLTAAESEKPLHTNSSAIYKPDWESTHIKVTNNAIIQSVSIFAIGFSKHFVADEGGDMSITNSNSNFGAISLESLGFRPESFDKDDVGYITHIIPPREPAERISNVTWLPIDTNKVISVGTTSKLYLYGYTNSDIVPPSQIDSYKVGAKIGEELYLSVVLGSGQNNFKSPVLMQVPSGIGTSSQKNYVVGRNSGINSISSNLIRLTSSHQLFNGETVRITSDNGSLPNNIVSDKVYYAYTTGLAANELKLSATLNDANSGNTISGISNGGGILKVTSYVADKSPGDVGHPIQFDSTNSQWYITGAATTSDNTIYSGIVGIGTSVLGESSGSTFLTRKLDNRSLEDKLYKVRYVIPKEFTGARPPTDGFILQESKSVGVGSVSYLTSDLDNNTQLRNTKLIIDASYSLGTVTVKTELPHNFIAGDEVTIKNIVSSNNTAGDNLFPYNGTFTIVTIPNPRTFTYTGLSSSPGTFLNQTNQRSTSQQIEALPTVSRSKYKDTLYIYKTTELKQFIPGSDGQDGIYNLTLVSSNISPDPNIGFGISARNFKQDIRNLYPQQDRDNYNSDPEPTTSFATLSPLGKINTNNKKNSLTKESLNYFLANNKVGYAITGAIISGTGNTTVTLYTNIDHNLNAIKRLTLTSGGTGYNNSAGVSTTIYASDLENGSIVGRNGVVKVAVSAGNTVSSITLVDGGGAYAVGNTMTVSSSPAAGPTSYAVVQVSEISDNTGDSLELTGCADPLFNGTFKIISVPSSKSVTIYNPNGIGTVFQSRTDNNYPLAVLSAKGVGVSTITFTKEVGIATVTSLTAHGLLPGNTFVLNGIGNTYFDRKLQVTNVIGINTFTFSSGITTITQTWSTNGVTVLKTGISANGKTLGSGEENLGGRGAYIYAGLSTSLSNSITKTDTSFVLPSSSGIKKADYLMIGAEIVRVVADPTSTTITVKRGQFSTLASAQDAGTQIKKIRVLPIEIRRPSILRASGHTFEYLGYGPGNYSTGLPLKQDRLLSDDEIKVAQAREQDGGAVVYTGMNDKGEFYNGATKVNGATGEETIIQAPIVTYFGDDTTNDMTTKRNSGIFDDMVIKERLTVEGGENQNQTSQFYGPVNFSQKVTNTSDNGLETKDLYIKGVASQAKLITVGISTPIDTEKSGDISLLSSPTTGGYLGHIYVDSDWRRFGVISREKNRSFLAVDQISVGSSGGIYNWTDAIEVNGTVKVQNLYVGGAVTFAGGQSISNATFEVLNVSKTLNLTGTGATNYSIVSSDATDIAQFQNLEVTGYAVTFTNPTVRFENSFNSVFSGISSIAGTLYFGGIRGNIGIITTLTAVNAGIETLSVSKNAYITSGIITDLSSTRATVTYLTGTASTITTFSGTTGTITNISGTTAIYDNIRANTNLVGVNGYINVGVVTTISGTNATYSNVTATNGYVNTGVVTTISGTNATYSNVIALNNFYTLTGVATFLSGSNLNYTGISTLTDIRTTKVNSTGIITATNFVSTVATGTSPLTVTSTTKVANLNADLLDDLNTSSTDTSGNSVVIRSSGNFSAGTITANLTGNASSADQVKTQQSTTNADFFITFVDTNNLSASNETVYTSTGIAYNPSTNNLTANGQITANSDLKLKTNIKTIDNALEKVLQLRGVEYDRIDIDQHQIGVIAQEVEEVLPDVISTNPDGIKSVAYGNIVAVLIESIKELKGEITELKSEIADLRSNK